jgi:hypothetical protein
VHIVLIDLLDHFVAVPSSFLPLLAANQLLPNDPCVSAFVHIVLIDLLNHFVAVPSSFLPLLAANQLLPYDPYFLFFLVQYKVIRGKGASVDSYDLRACLTWQPTAATKFYLPSVAHSASLPRVASHQPFNILTQHSLQYFVIPREQPHYVPRRKWNVKKESQLAPQFLFFHHLKGTANFRRQLEYISGYNKTLIKKQNRSKTISVTGREGR